jgi:hypothetical protein
MVRYGCTLPPPIPSLPAGDANFAHLTAALSALGVGSGTGSAAPAELPQARRDRAMRTLRTPLARRAVRAPIRTICRARAAARACGASGRAGGGRWRATEKAADARIAETDQRAEALGGTRSSRRGQR